MLRTIIGTCISRTIPTCTSYLNCQLTAKNYFNTSSHLCTTYWSRSSPTTIEKSREEIEVEDFDLEGMQTHGFTTPTEETFSMVIGGTRFDQLPVAWIKAEKNNTMVDMYDYTGVHRVHFSSAGIEGFSKARKGTSVGAQAAGLAVGQAASRKGVKFIRVVVKGLGSGRLASMKGLQMGGMNIVSITDNTIIKFTDVRSRKVRKL